MNSDHQRALEFDRHVGQVAELRRRARQWRLIDCSEETLVRMRHALIDEMERLEERLRDADNYFTAYIDRGQPLEAEGMRERIDRMADEWTQLNRRLQALDEATLERALNSRLVAVLGSQRRLNFLDSLLLISILVVVILTLLEYLLPLTPGTIEIIRILDFSFCVLLMADFLLRLYLVEDRGWYWRHYWIDFLSAIPFYEFFRIGRLLQLARFLRLFRLFRLARAMRIVFWRYPGLSKLLQTFQLVLLRRSVTVAAILLIVGAFGIQLAEASETSAPQAFQESVWWSFVTMVTGGFADLYNPATTAGQLMTAGLVLLGLTVTGIFTASLTSVLVEDDSTRIEQNQHSLENRLQVIDHKLDLMSGETNQGLIALEEIAQQLSNAASTAAIAELLCLAMMRHFECLQASVHLLTPAGDKLQRVHAIGLEEAFPPQNLSLGNGFLGQTIQDLLTLE
ncbi:MAG: potassium channel family protein, partial [Anaerolineales bacterium]|nr:potassium channel family protein [Anaerolineales bacterium]